MKNVGSNSINKIVVLLIVILIGFSFPEEEITKSGCDSLFEMITGKIKEESDVRATAVYQLAGCNKGKYIPFILPYLANDSDTYVRAAIADVCTHWGNREIVLPALIDARGDKSAKVRIKVAHALISRENEMDAIPVLINLVGNKEVAGVTWGEFIRIKKDQAKDTIREMLKRVKEEKSNSEFTRAYASLLILICCGESIANDTMVIKSYLQNDKVNESILYMLGYIGKRNTEMRKYCVNELKQIANLKDARLQKIANEELLRIENK
jgi:HEAT repeat protein